jgi:hypothetical protein
MARPSDVTDPILQTGLREAEQALDDGEWLECVRKSAAAYTHLAETRPETIVRNGPAVSDLPTGGRPENRGAVRPWPDLFGVTATWDGDRPTMVFDKQKFTMSEAVTYFEYTLDSAIRAERS